MCRRYEFLTRRRLMMNVKLIGIFSCALILTGCAVPGTSTSFNTDPKQTGFSYEKRIDRPQTDVWDTMVKNIAQSFFVINNIDKNSRIINLSISSDKPQDYLDCGRTTRTYNDGKTTTTYEYGMVDGFTTYIVASPNQPSPYFSQRFAIARSAKLDGRANIYVAPEGSGTLVSVNAKAIVRITLSGEVQNVHPMGNIVGRHPFPPQTGEVTGITKGSTVNTMSDGTRITCYSTGNLEKAILDLTE